GSYHYSLVLRREHEAPQVRRGPACRLDHLVVLVTNSDTAGELRDIRGVNPVPPLVDGEPASVSGPEGDVDDVQVGVEELRECVADSVLVVVLGGFLQRGK